MKVWRDCVRCPKFDCCDEIAVVKHLVADPPPDPYLKESDGGSIRFPILKH